MSELPLSGAIPRFKTNEDRVNVFVNGDSSATWVTSGGTTVPSLRKLIAELPDTLSLAIAAETAARIAETAARIDADTAETSVRMMADARSLSLSSMPAGAIGVWMMDQTTATPRLVTPNLLDTTPTSKNVMLYPRRFFNTPYWEKNGNVTIVDANAVGPDGKMEASTLSCVNTWYMSPRGASAGTFVLPAGTWTVAASVRSISGDPTFTFGYGASTSVRTAGTVWGAGTRIAQTFTSTGAAAAPVFRWPGSGSTAVFAVCDYEIFSGAVDLGPMPLGSHIYSGSPVSTDVPGFAGLALDFSTQGHARVDLGSDQALDEASVVYMVEKVGTGGGFVNPIFAREGDGYRYFVVGEGYPNNQTPGFSSDAVGIGCTSMGRPDLWDRTGAGIHISGSRFNAARGDLWINGNLVEKTTIALSGYAVVRDMLVGSSYWGQFRSGYKIHGIALFDRYLTDQEMLNAYRAMVQYSRRRPFAIPATSPEKLLFSFGDSITYGFNATSGNGYVYKTAATASPVIRGVNYGVSSYQVANVTSQLDAGVGAILAAAAASRNRKVIVSLFIGANDLGNGSTAPANATAFLASLATLCDKIRAYHPAIKLILCTILPRSSQADGGTQFNIVRNSANTTMRTWVGTHCDAIADFGDTGTTMGADGASNNGTYYTAADKVHPTEAGHVLLEPIFTAAVNAL